MGRRPTVVVICGLLCLAVVLVFCQTAGYDFVNFDDDHYVYENEHLNRGFTWDGLVYYAVHWHAYTYHPLSTYSHMLDCQAFGLKAGWHHGMNVALHAITATMLFLLVRQMTGRLWPSALVAALFAIHPLRVESVAWIAERKDVLSGLFFVLTLGAYVRYVRAGGAGILPASPGSVGILPACAGRYAIVCLLYVLGLLAKPMLVTLPLVLLLLDYWPLRRWQADAGKMPTLLFLEKIPLLLLSLADSALTVHTQVDAIQSLEAVSWMSRLANALVAYVSYLGCLVWPQGLAILYPRPSEGFSAGTAIAMALVLAALSAGVLVWRRQAPYLFVGWLWYLGMLVPVIGLLQVGGQRMADRYTYLPQIGLVLGLVWAMADLSGLLTGRGGAAMRRASRRRQDAYATSRLLLALSAAGIVAALVVAAWRQTGYWRDSETLWVRDMMYPNTTAHYNLGLALAKADRHREAIEQFQATLAIDPKDQDTHNSLGSSYEALGQLDDAAREFRSVLARIQEAVDSHNKLADDLQLQGNESGAQEQRRAALEKMKEATDANKNLARILRRQDKDHGRQNAATSKFDTLEQGR
jgi:tetratricopeptide (TPR) repeat protein